MQKMYLQIGATEPWQSLHWGSAFVVFSLLMQLLMCCLAFQPSVTVYLALLRPSLCGAEGRAALPRARGLMQG
jgi:hypothetical protein